MNMSPFQMKRSSVKGQRSFPSHSRFCGGPQGGRVQGPNVQCGFGKGILKLQAQPLRLETNVH